MQKVKIRPLFLPLTSSSLPPNSLRSFWYCALIEIPFCLVGIWFDQEKVNGFLEPDTN